MPSKPHGAHAALGEQAVHDVSAPEQVPDRNWRRFGDVFGIRIARRTRGKLRYRRLHETDGGAVNKG